MDSYLYVTMMLRCGLGGVNDLDLRAPVVMRNAVLHHVR